MNLRPKQIVGGWARPQAESGVYKTGEFSTVALLAINMYDYLRGKSSPVQHGTDATTT